MLSMETRIQNALFTLMQTKSITDISITELVEEVGCSRTSFYRSFKNKNDVIEQYLYSGFEDLAEQMQGMSGQDFIRQMLLFTKADQNRLKLLFEQGFLEMIILIINRESLKRFSGNDISEQMRYFTYALNGMLINAVICWIQDDCRTDIETLVNTLSDLAYSLQAGMQPQSNRK